MTMNYFVLTVVLKKIYNCGTKKDIQEISNKKEDNTNFLLSNLIVFLLFIVDMIVLFLGINTSLFKSIIEDPVGSGLILLFVPIVAALFVIPHFIGTIMSGINLKTKSYKILIFLFVISIISLILTMVSSSKSFTGNNGLLFWLSLILNILLCIIILLKLKLKNKS